jgi:DNA-directed RNA polymerase subunit RPC12/RpoP
MDKDNTEKYNPRCLTCGGKMWKSGITPTGKQKYFCNPCWLRNRKSNEAKKNPPCPKCGHKMKKNGVHSDGRQKWRCTPCGASQISNPKPEGRPRIHEKITTSDPKPVGRPRIYPGRNLTDAESYLRHKKKKAMLALRAKFGTD